MAAIENSEDRGVPSADLDKPLTPYTGTGEFAQARPSYITGIGFDTSTVNYQFFMAGTPATEGDSLKDLVTGGSVTYWEAKVANDTATTTGSVGKVTPLNSSIIKAEVGKWLNVNVGYDNHKTNYKAGVYVQGAFGDSKSAMCQNYSANDGFTFSTMGGNRTQGVTIPTLSILKNGKTSWHDIGWDVKPSYTSPKGNANKFKSDQETSKTQSLFPLVETPKWYRRANVQTVTHKDYGTRSFFVATDALSNFYIYPVDYGVYIGVGRDTAIMSEEEKANFVNVDKAEFDALIASELVKDPNKSGYFIKAYSNSLKIFKPIWAWIGEEPTLDTFIKPIYDTYELGETFQHDLTYWKNERVSPVYASADGGSTDRLMGIDANFKDYKYIQPFHYLWSFNYNATRATTIAYRQDAPITFIKFDGTRSPIYTLENSVYLFSETAATYPDSSLPGVPTVPNKTDSSMKPCKAYLPVLVEVSIDITLTAQTETGFSVNFQTSLVESSTDSDKYYTSSGYTSPVFSKDIDPATLQPKITDGNELAYAYVEIYGKPTIEGEEEVQDVLFTTPVPWDEDIKDATTEFKAADTTIIDFTKMLLGHIPYSIETITGFINQIEATKLAKLKNFIKTEPNAYYQGTLNGYLDYITDKSTYCDVILGKEDGSPIVLNDFGKTSPISYTPVFTGFPWVLPPLAKIFNDDTRLNECFYALCLLFDFGFASSDRGAYWKVSGFNHGDPAILEFAKYVESTLTDCPVYKVANAETIALDQQAVVTYNQAVADAVNLPPAERDAVYAAAFQTYQAQLKANIRNAGTPYPRMGLMILDLMEGSVDSYLWHTMQNFKNWHYVHAAPSQLDRLKVMVYEELKKLSKNTGVLNPLFCQQVDYLITRVITWGFLYDLYSATNSDFPTRYDKFTLSLMAQLLLSKQNSFDMAPDSPHQDYIDGYLGKLPKLCGQIIDGALNLNIYGATLYSPNKTINYKETAATSENYTPEFYYTQLSNDKYRHYILGTNTYTFGKKTREVDVFLKLETRKNDIITEKGVFNILRTDYLSLYTTSVHLANLPQVDYSNYTSQHYRTTTHLSPHLYGDTPYLTFKYETEWLNISYTWILAHDKTSTEFTGRVFSNAFSLEGFYHTNAETHNASVADINFDNLAVLFNGMRANWHYPSTFKVGNALYALETAPTIKEVNVDENGNPIEIIELKKVMTGFRRNGMFSDIDITDVLTTMAPRDGAIKLNSKKFRLLYEYIYLNHFIDDVVPNPSLYRHSSLHEKQFEDLRDTLDPATPEIKTENTDRIEGLTLGYNPMPNLILRSHTYTHHNGSLAVYTVPSYGSLSYLNETGLTFEAGTYAKNVYDVYLAEFKINWATIDYIRAYNLKYKPASTTVTDKGEVTVPAKGEKWVVSTHKALFNEAFGQSSTTYTSFMGKALNPAAKESWYMGGYCTSGAWFTYKLPLLDKDLVEKSQ